MSAQPGTGSVRTADLARVLREFLAHAAAGRRAPLQLLCERTRRSERFLARILREESEVVPFLVADAIVVAIDRVEVFHTGECPIIEPDVEDVGADDVAPAGFRPGFKRCFGEFCGGRELPRTPEYFSFYRSGRDVGRPRSYCRECDRHRVRVYLRLRRRRDPERSRAADHDRLRAKRTRYPPESPCGLVPIERLRFAVEELVRVYGARDAAERLGISSHCLWAWRSGRRKRMHKEMARRVLRLLQETRGGNPAEPAAEPRSLVIAGCRKGQRRTGPVGQAPGARG